MKRSTKVTADRGLQQIHIAESTEYLAPRSSLLFVLLSRAETDACVVARKNGFEWSAPHRLAERGGNCALRRQRPSIAVFLARLRSDRTGNFAATERQCFSC